MNIHRRTLIILVIGTLVSALFTSLAYAHPPAQDPRPPTDSNGGTGGTSGGNGGNGDSGTACAALKGQVLTWGVGGTGGVGVVLNTGSWQVDTTSASDGNYGFGGLGVGVAKLSVVLPPEQVGQLEPIAQEIGVYLSCDFPLFANLAVYSGPRPSPPANIRLSAPTSLTPGQNAVIRLVVKNELPTEISNVAISNLIPAGLTAIDAAIADGNGSNVQIIDGGIDGQLVFATIDKISPDAEENLLITVAVAPDLATGTQIRNTASLLYRESAADQDWIDFTVGANGLPVPAAEPDEVEAAQAEATATPEPATPAPEPTPTTAPEPTAEAEQADDFVPPEKLPTTGDEFFPPPDLLPETGESLLAIPDTLPETGVGVVLPLLGFALGGLAFTTHQFRIYWRTRK
jgi:uncharacterized repeat protein (TIGR01451 family)